MGHVNGDADKLKMEFKQSDEVASSCNMKASTITRENKKIDKVN